MYLNIFVISCGNVRPTGFTVLYFILQTLLIILVCFDHFNFLCKALNYPCVCYLNKLKYIY